MSEAPVNPDQDENGTDVTEADVTHFHEDGDDVEKYIGEPVEYDLGSDDE